MIQELANIKLAELAEVLTPDRPLPGEPPTISSRAEYLAFVKQALAIATSRLDNKRLSIAYLRSRTRPVRKSGNTVIRQRVPDGQPGYRFGTIVRFYLDGQQYIGVSFCRETDYLAGRHSRHQGILQAIRNAQTVPDDVFETSAATESLIAKLSTCRRFSKELAETIRWMATMHLERQRQDAEVAAIAAAQMDAAVEESKEQ